MQMYVCTYVCMHAYIKSDKCIQAIRYVKIQSMEWGEICSQYLRTYLRMYNKYVHAQTGPYHRDAGDGWVWWQCTITQYCIKFLRCLKLRWMYLCMPAAAAVLVFQSWMFKLWMKLKCDKKREQLKMAFRGPCGMCCMRWGREQGRGAGICPHGEILRGNAVMHMNPSLHCVFHFSQRCTTTHSPWTMSTLRTDLKIGADVETSYVWYGLNSSSYIRTYVCGNVWIKQLQLY